MANFNKKIKNMETLVKKNAPSLKGRNLHKFLHYDHGLCQVKFKEINIYF